MKLYDSGVFLVRGTQIIEDINQLKASCEHEGLLKGETADSVCSPERARKNTIAYDILRKHNKASDMSKLQMRYDSLTSHDITYVGIIQTARASGMTEFPMPYVLTNCHNSLCAVGGTINEDDHKFALSAAHKYGGIYVPTNMAVIHSFNREMMAGCGRMILGSDSHTRYGAIGTMGVGEGGGELAKQLVGRTYDMAVPEVIAVYLDGEVRPGVGPQDVALAIIGAVFGNGYVKNKVMEFVGPGIAKLPMEYRNSIDVMTTETTCWSSIWCTDDKTKDYLTSHGRADAYAKLAPGDVTYYDGCIYVDLSSIECSIALPMHPSNVVTIKELKANAADILHECEQNANKQIKGASLDLMSKIKNGDVYVDQGIIAGCSGGTFDNILAAADILKGKSCGNGTFTLSVYPGSMPAYIDLSRRGVLADIAAAGAIVRECFCGPCFGAGDTPANGEFSIRHATRNFPNREGSKPGEGQMAGVALMDARSIAATAVNGGRLTAASELDVEYTDAEGAFDASVYEKRIYNGYGHAEPDTELKMGPNIKDWPHMPELSEDIMLRVVSHIDDPVTTTDELIPSGETSSFRSNPLRLAEFTLSRKDPAYVGLAKKVHEIELMRESSAALSDEAKKAYSALNKKGITCEPDKTVIASTIYACKPGDGSAREQAASCQRVLGAGANLAREYATKRYRSNCINWGMIPFISGDGDKYDVGDWVFVPGIRKAILDATEKFPAYVIKSDGTINEIILSVGQLTEAERHIICDGCLINYYKKNR